jgi:predicted MFS family arabinose efflux permease
MGRRSALALLAVLGVGVFLAGLELMITAVALPAIVIDLADWTHLRAASWVINGYLLVSIVVMPLAGQLCDRYGIRRVFLGSLAVFVAGSILAGRATGLADLIAARLVQALGGGSLVPVATAAASHLYGGPARARALGVIGALTFLGMAAGPFAGAWIMQTIHPAAALGAGLGVLALVAIAAAVFVGRRRAEPFVAPDWFRLPAFASATLVSLLTGYGFATAIIGGAVFVDRVLYGGPDLQRVALGSLAAATALGALASGFVLRAAGLRLTTIVGLAASTVALVRMSSWGQGTSLGEVAAWLALFGLGFGLTVTPRSAAAVEALGPRAYGVASAAVTVARMLGMALGLAALTAFGSTIIDQLWAAIRATPDAYKAFIPETLRNRAFEDGLVVQALEAWASGEAARILVGVFLVAAAVMALAALPALRLGSGKKAAEPA